MVGWSNTIKMNLHVRGCCLLVASDLQFFQVNPLAQYNAMHRPIKSLKELCISIGAVDPLGRRRVSILLQESGHTEMGEWTHWSGRVARLGLGKLSCQGTLDTSQAQGWGQTIGGLEGTGSLHCNGL